MVLALGVTDGAHAARSTGTVDHVGWSLDGRHLTLTLTKPLEAPRTPARVSCGDDASYEPGVFPPESVWADVVSARVGLRRDVRSIRVTFSRDISRRVNRCVLVVGGSFRGRAIDTAMRLVRGHRPGCRPGRHERVIARSGEVRIMRTHSRLLDDGFEVGSDDAYRACRGTSQRPRTITMGGVSSGGGSSNGSWTPTMFRVAGGHVAWATTGDSAQEPLPPSIATVDIDGPIRRAATFAAGSGPQYLGLGTVTQLAITTSGAITWVIEQPGGPTLAFQRDPDGQIRQLAAATST